MAGDDGWVVLILNTDEFVSEYKGKAPVQTYAEREAVLEALRYVDEVIPNIGGSDLKPALLLADPELIVVGDDWAHKDYLGQIDATEDWLEDNNFGLVYVRREGNQSTTQLKVRVKEY